MLQRPLVFLALCVIAVYTSKQSADDCAYESGNLCLTKAKFWSWESARDDCIALGGDLAIPEPESEDFLRDSTSWYDSVWVGGRAIRLWSRDNSSFYFGKWDGCVEDRIIGIDFYPNDTLSECLLSCSTSEYAYVKKSSCACSDNYFSAFKTITCTDPFSWSTSEMKAENIHRFHMKSKDEIGAAADCGTVKVNRHSLDLETKYCHGKQYHGLCQSAKNPQKSVVKYGDSFPWRSDDKTDWASADQLCGENNGTLVKLEWNSPLLFKALYQKYGTTQMWIGTDRIKWQFIDGREVTSVWTNFQPNSQKGCLVWRVDWSSVDWGSVELEDALCSSSYHTPIQALCKLPVVTTPVFTSTREVTTLRTTLTTTYTTNQHGVTTLTSTGTTSQQPVTSVYSTVSTHPTTFTLNITALALDVTTLKAATHGSSTAVGIGVGVSLAVIAGCVIVAVIMFWRVRKKSSRPNRPISSQYYNAAYAATSAQDVIMNSAVTCRPTNGGSTTPQTLPTVSQEELIYVNMPNTTIVGNYVNIHIGSDNKQDQSDHYDKLSKPRVHPPPSAPHEPPPAYSVVSLDADGGYVNCSDISQTAHYAHSVTTRQLRAGDDAEYDQLSTSKFTPPPEAEMFSVYNHVGGEESV